uniref:Uncharacterized protein n=1 Tax=Rhizophora mucronata TaxID=61149 RepID=A0A2P2R315_RHIMU
MGNICTKMDLVINRLKFRKLYKIMADCLWTMWNRWRIFVLILRCLNVLNSNICLQ